MPVAPDVVQAAAVAHGVCVRPVPMKVTDTTTGEVAFVDVPKWLATRPLVRAVARSRFVRASGSERSGVTLTRAWVMIDGRWTCWM